MVHETDFPQSSALYDKKFEYSFRDAYLVPIREKNIGAIHVYYEVFSSLPKPVSSLMNLRNSIAVFFGFEAGSALMCGELENIVAGHKAGFLTFESVSTTEVIATAVEDNMQIWISVLEISAKEYVISTLVHLKTKSSRWYMKIIQPFHKWVAKYTINQKIKQNRL
ncbi:MAG: hypothetical protein ACJAZQ_001857 [Cognaticolwellia sp.]|jgi:hypothetical protein